MTRDAASTASEIMTAREVADLLRVNIKTVYEAHQRGELHGRRIGKRCIRFSRAAVLRFMEQGRVSSSEGE